MRAHKKDLIELIKYSACNIASWLVDLGIFTIVFEIIGMYYLVAKAISYTIGIMVSYALNREFTFNTKYSFVSGALLKFILISCLSLIMSLASMYMFRDILHLSAWIAYFLSIIFSFSTNFLGNKFWSFREGK